MRYVATIIVISIAVLARAQCPNNNTLFSVAATPASCPGSITANCIFGGEYVLVNVVAGNTYTFSTCGGAAWDTQITLYNNAGGGSLGFNDDACGLQSTVTWVATFTGQLRVLIDLYNCASNFSCANLTVTCIPPSVPSDCVYTLTLYDSFSDGWGTSFVGVSINGGPFQNYTVPFGTPSVTIPIPVNIGDVVVLSYNASGAWQTDNSYTLMLGGGMLYSSGSPPPAGTVYAATVTCNPPPASQEDCIGAMTICSNLSLNNNTNHTGGVVDIHPGNSGCLDTQEYQGTWYVFSPSAGGDLGFTIVPNGPDDYDWAVWGPYPPGTTPGSICPPAGPPIRCAASSGPATFNNTGSYGTGMGHATFSPPQFASTAVSYGLPATTDICPLIAPQRCGWVPGMQVTVGQVYLMYISNWSQTNSGFSLNWNLQNGASLECVILPMDLFAFDAHARDGRVSLNWSVGREKDERRYEVERSAHGMAYQRIGTVAGSGSAPGAHHYNFVDDAPPMGVVTYRLKLVDTGDAGSYSVERAVLIGNGGGGLSLVPNPGRDLIDVMIPGSVEAGWLTLMDATGRMVLRARTEGAMTRLDASPFPSGLYAVLLTDEHGRPVARSVWVKE